MVHRSSGEPIRRKLSEEEVRNYRLGLLSQMLNKKEKGKEPVRNPREEEERSESMGLDEPSTSATLAPPLQELTRGPSSTAGQEAPAKSSFGESQGLNSRSASELAPAAATATTIAASSLRHPAVASSSSVVEVPPLPKFPPYVGFNPPMRPRLRRDLLEHEDFAWIRDMEDWMASTEARLFKVDRYMKSFYQDRR
jgi:hypothetical protein